MNNPSTKQDNEQISNKPHTQRNNVTGDEIDLRELLYIVWQGKWVAIIITSLFLIGSLIFAVKQPNVYKSEALLAPTNSENGGGGLAALAGQFGGIASMAGIDLGSKGAGDKTQIAIEVMKSRRFIGDFIKKHNLLPDLMAAKQWNMHDNSISYDEKKYLVSNNEWVREVAAPLKSKPSLQEAYREFSKILHVNTNKDTGMITISIEHISPYLAEYWISLFIQDINSEMKQRDVTEANKSIEFLENKIKQTNIADIRAVLYKLVEEQAKTIMFAEVREEYVFKTIDPAFVPEKKFKPKRGMIVIVGFILGFVFSVLGLFIKYVFVRKKHFYNQKMKVE